MLSDVFNARSVAVVGASASPEKTGHTILKNIVEGGFEGRIYPINPKAESILGLKCYANLSLIPEQIDLVILVIPASLVPNAMEEAGSKGAKGAVIISGGFREIGNFELETEVLRIAQKYSIRVIGPNCQGFNYRPNKLCATWPLATAQGSMAVISQSGTIGAALELWAEDEHLGISGFVSLGNKSDVNDVDLLEFFGSDPSTGVIALYLEGVKDGSEFIEAVQKVNKSKPIVVLKPGKTEKGKKAAESHTKSIGGSDQIFDAVCKKYGIIRAHDVTEFYDYSKALGFLSRPQGNKMLVITSSGGSGIIATDEAEIRGIDVATLSSGLSEELKSILPSQCVVSNPLDLTGDATAERYAMTLAAAIEENTFDFFLVIFGDPIPGAFEVIKDISSKTDKPILVSYLGGGATEKEEVKKMHLHGIPAFPTPERAVKAAKALLSQKYGKGVVKY